MKLSTRSPLDRTPAARRMWGAVFAVALAWLSGTSGRADEEARDDGAWRFPRFPTALLAESEVTWQVGRAARIPAGVRLVWSITAQERTVARGQATWHEADDERTVASIEWTAPAVKDGVIVPVLGRFWLVDEGRTQRAITREAWIFSSDPFVHRHEWLKSLDLVLLASDERKEKVLKTADVPLRSISGAAAVDRLRREVLLVSDGQPTGDRRVPVAAIEAFVRRGGRCLWITPRQGTRLLTAAADESAEQDTPRSPVERSVRWESFDLRRQSVVREFDKRLDAATWRDDQAGLTFLQPAARRGPDGRSWFAWEATDRHDGWPWLDASTADGGRLIVCGFPLLDDWQRDATPRYLFAQVLQALSRPEPQQPPGPTPRTNGP